MEQNLIQEKLERICCSLYNVDAKNHSKGYTKNIAVESSIGKFSTRTLGHSSISRELVDKIDHIPSYLICQRTFQVTLKEVGWRRSLRRASETYNIYIKSKMANGVGDGIYCLRLDRRPFKLLEYCSIFRAEVFAGKETAEIVNKEGNMHIN